MREVLSQAMDEAEATFARAGGSSTRLEAEAIDVTMPGEAPHRGTLPLTLVLGEVRDIFTTMGFEVMEGPEIGDWTTSTLRCSTFPKTIRRATCRIPFTSMKTWSCAPTPRRCRRAPCSRASRRSA